MLEFLKTILHNDFGSFGFVFSLTTFIIWLAFKGGKLIEKYKIVDKLEKNIDKIKDDISFIKASIDVNKRNSDLYAQSQSPINLNAKGTATSKKLDAKKIVNAVWDIIERDISIALSKTEKKNPYTIQEVCFHLCESYSKYFNSEDMEHIKNIAYQEGVSLSAFDLLFGIEVRNRYFKDHNIIVDDIDKHAPDKTKN